ncbi:VIT1/CCC1 transporter family protein [Sediminicoccus sp. KRV36]|uniref:VIT1/CCC1 transporter family protein n=1 Tax=Sediminicoccus sp. KRV36 TaxID=3133721 RepID=UPI00200DF1CB|nr:VIT1/CCC1 transporter family protein [Sediminicoccus rosea]UPY37458.1 VIT1/CCC1 transporter family protein [Sediminicoccus rosea]
MDQTAPHPYRDGLPPAPPGPPEGEQHALLSRAEVPFLTGLTQGPVLPLAVVIGMMALGISGPALLAGGIAALGAGAVVAALSRYFAVLGATERYAAERARELIETETYPERERWEVAAVLHRYGLRGDTLARAVEAIAADQRRWVDFMMRFELDLIEPQPARAAQEAVALAVGQALGGLLPLLPLMLLPMPSAFWPLIIALCAMAPAGWLLARAEGQVAPGGALRALLLAGAGALAALALIALM